MADETTVENQDESPRPTKRRWTKRLAWLAVTLLVLLIAGELFARFYLGLGDPPLSQADPQIEYLFKPDQDCHRFGHHIHYNHYSMRSEDFPPHKSQPNELRVMVVGDSVVNGGALTDQSEIATSIMEKKLAEDLKRPVVVGNISAGSWGPPNELAYLKRYGLFDADVLVIVVSSHDYADVPTFEPVVGTRAYPDHKPLLALWEGFDRYVLPKFSKKKEANEGFVATTAPAKEEDVRACMTAIRDMIEMGRSAGAKVIVAQHLERAEKLASPLRGHEVIKAEVIKDGITPVELGKAYEAARAKGEQPYRDAIHPNPVGQRVMADTLVKAIEEVVK
jgi:hypothetical protein